MRTERLEFGWNFEVTEPDLAYILVETLIFEIERVPVAFRAWTLLKRHPKPVQHAETHMIRGNPGKIHEHSFTKRTFAKASRLSRVREPQSYRRLRPGRDNLPRLWTGSLSEPNEPRPRMASLHQRGEGREGTSRNTNILLHSRQRTLNSDRPSQPRRLRQTTPLRDKNGNAPSPEMADPDSSTLILRSQSSTGNVRAGPPNRQAACTSQRQGRLSSRIQKGAGHWTGQRTLNCRDSSRVTLRS